MPLRYKALDPHADEIRLLRKLPSKDKVLHFSLEIFPLSTAPPFWAFSYVWGDPKKTSRIVVNNHNVKATENLVAALTTHVHDIMSGLRVVLPSSKHAQIQYLWADAVCINQDDKKEQAQQLLKMREIYQKGSVCVYLNKSDRDALKSVYNVLNQLGKATTETPVLRISGRMRRELFEFFSHDWFHRMWMIQEFVLADSQPLILFMGGHKAVCEQQLRDAAWAIFQQPSDFLTVDEEYLLLSGVKQYMCLAEVKERIKGGSNCSFLDLLWTFRDRLASDPRDKIYSLLGILHPSQIDRNSGLSSLNSCECGIAIEELVVDYEATVEDVYASLVKSVILGSDSLNILCACQSPGRFERSWVPDWTEPWSRLSLLTNSIGLTHDTFRVDRFDASAGQKPVIEFEENLRSISVSGTSFSMISVLGSRPQGCTDSQWLKDWFVEQDASIRTQISFTYGVGFEEVLDCFTLSVCATSTADDGFTCSEVLADKYYLPFAGASVEWKEMVRIYRDGSLNKGELENFLIDIRIAQMLDGRKIFIGEEGYCGLVPDHTEREDLICVLFGCDVPVVLRRIGECYAFIGECYVRGMMRGEAVRAVEEERMSCQRFTII